MNNLFDSFIKFMNKSFNIFLMIPFGIIIIVLGIVIWKKQCVNLIHDNRYKRASRKDKKEYSSKIGKSVIVMGTGMFLNGIFDIFTDTEFGWVIFIITFIFSMMTIISTQNKFNHG